MKHCWIYTEEFGLLQDSVNYLFKCLYSHFWVDENGFSASSDREQPSVQSVGRAGFDDQPGNRPSWDGFTQAVSANTWQMPSLVITGRADTDVKFWAVKLALTYD